MQSCCSQSGGPAQTDEGTCGEKFHRPTCLCLSKAFLEVFAHFFFSLKEWLPIFSSVVVTEDVQTFEKAFGKFDMNYFLVFCGLGLCFSHPCITCSVRWRRGSGISV